MFGRMLLVSLLGCGAPGECAAFDAMEATDPEGVGGDEGVAMVASTIADFAAWTGMPGVCVPEVRLVGEIPWETDVGDPIGVYQGPGEPILVEPSHDVWGRRETVIHELCHALDDTLVLSPQATGPFFAPQPREGRAPSFDEAFADACEMGADDWHLGLLEAVEATCGETFVDPRLRVLGERVFPGHERASPTPTGTVPLELGALPVDVPDDAWIAEIVGGGPDLWALVLPASAKAWVGRIDRSTGALVDAVAFPGDGDDGGWLLQADEGGPVVVTRAGAWRVANGALEALRIDPAALAGAQVVHGVLLDGVLWMRTFDDEASRLLRVDPATGAVADVDLPEAWADAWPSQARDGVVLTDRGRWGELDPVTGEVDEHTLPDWVNRLPALLPDGRAVAMWYSVADLDQDDWRYGLAVEDAAGWALPEGSCGTERWKWFDLVATSDAVWAWDAGRERIHRLDF